MSAQKEAKDPPSFTSFNPAEASTSKPPSFSSFNPPGPSSSNRPPTFSSFSPAAPPSRISRDQEEKGDGLREKGKGKEQEKERRLDGFERKEHRRRRHDRHDRGKDHSSHHRKRHEPDQEDHEERRKERRNHRNGDGRDDETIDLTETSSSRSRQHDSISYLRQESNQHLSSYHRRSDSRHHRPYRDRSEESVVRPISNSTFGIPSNHLNHGCGALSLNLKPTTAPPSYERDLYYTDLIGDDKAAKFGQDFSKVPRSHRAGGGRVLGLDEGLRITLESAKGRKGKGLMLAPGGKQRHRYVSSSQAWRTFERPQKRVRVGSKPGLIGIETWTDYIELRTRKPKTQGHESGPRHRVSLDLFPEDEEESASDASILGESEEDTDTFEDPYDQVRRKSRELNSRVLQDPQDTAAWLELVELQESIIESGGQEKIDILPRKMSRRSRRREAELAEEALKKTRATRRKALAAIQLSVLDRALGQFTASQPVELVLARLRTAASSGLWDSERLQKEWNKILETDRRENHNHLEESILLWSEYLEWRASDWSLFEFMAVWKEFARGVAAMGSRASMFSYECAERSKCEQAQIQIASMACKLAREAGFVEWGIAVSQALLELNSSRPEGLSEPPFQPSVLERDYASSSEQEMAWIEKVLDSLQSFWDKEGLRLGEEGASGWDVASSQPESDPFNVERPPPEYEKAFSDEPIPKDPFERWRSTELSRSKTRSLPARTTDKPLWKASEEEIDPDSIVFFSDIRPLLFVVHCQNSKVALLDLSLEAAGLPSNLVSSLSHNATGPATKHHSVSLELSDQFWPEELRDLSRNKFDLPMSSESIEGLRMERERKSFLADPSRCPIKSWPVTLENIFSNPGVSPLSQDVSCALHSSTPANHRFARRILDQVGRRINHVSIQLLRLGLEAHVSLKLAIKLAKKILSDDRQNLVLWNAYAELEKKAGKVESARTVYLTTLESLSGLGENGIKEAPAIWAALSELEWKQGRPDQALGVLMLAASSRLHTTLSVGNKLKEILGNDFKISDVAIRQTREDFASINSQMHFSFGPKQLPKVVFCLALFEHLIQPAGSGISAACKVFESKAKIFESKDAENGTRVAEDILTHEVRFIRHHVDSKGSFRPSDARRALTAAVEAAPSNTEFFSNLAANEMRSKVENYLRLTLERVTLGDRREARRTLIRRQPEEEAVRWLYAVYVELNLHTTSFNEHSVRRIFEQAVEAEGARHSAHIWKAFIDFECRLHTFRDGSGSERERKTHLLRAKSLVYRAIHNCPSCKDLYMVAFSRPLRSVMKSDELRMMFEMMCEKGLRQFVHLEDFLEDWEREEEEEEDAMSEDDASGSVGDGGVRQMKRQRQPADSDDSDFEDGVLKEGRKRKAIYEQVGGGEPPHLESPAGDRSSSAAGLEIEAKGSVPMCYYEEPPPKASLETLPIELLFSILLISASSSLPSVSRQFKWIFNRAPSSIKVEFLLEKWFESYRQNFKYDPILPSPRYPIQDASGSVISKVTSATGMESRTPSSVLSTTFVPVLDKAKSNPHFANAEVLTFAARFGICTAEILVKLEARVLSDKRLGNIAQSCGIFEAEGDMLPKRLKCSELPKRLFRSIKEQPSRACSELVVNPCNKRRRTGEADDVEAETGQGGRASHGIDFIELLGLFHPSPTGGAMGERAPSPSSENVNLILQLLLLHDSDPNSHSGYPLAMTVHHSSEPLMGLLLYKGANPCMKKNLALQIAVRKGWDQGLRWMIEREERLERVWTRHELHVVQILEGWRRRVLLLEPPSSDTVIDKYPSSRHDADRRQQGEGSASPSSSQDLVKKEEATVAAAFSEVQHEITRHHGDPNPHSNKRRRLFDRLRPDPELLREAIRSDSWSIVDFLMAEKGVVPDMKSLKLMEKKKSKC